VEMCDDKDVQRLTFDSYLYKRVVAMNPWQQLKLTLLTLGSVLRGNALAPQGYKPVPSAVRDEAEVNAMLAVSTIKGGIRVGKAKEGKANAAVASSDSASDEREPVLAGKG
jgi:geranylgeranyl reductase